MSVVRVSTGTASHAPSEINVAGIKGGQFDIVSTADHHAPEILDGKACRPCPGASQAAASNATLDGAARVDIDETEGNPRADSRGREDRLPSSGQVAGKLVETVCRKGIDGHERQQSGRRKLVGPLVRENWFSRQRQRQRQRRRRTALLQGLPLPVKRPGAVEQLKQEWAGCAALEAGGCHLGGSLFSLCFLEYAINPVFERFATAGAFIPCLCYIPSRGQRGRWACRLLSVVSRFQMLGLEAQIKRRQGLLGWVTSNSVESLVMRAFFSGDQVNTMQTSERPVPLFLLIASTRFTTTYSVVIEFSRHKDTRPKNMLYRVYTTKEKLLRA